jgi:aldehyde dehydrogenase
MSFESRYDNFIGGEWVAPAAGRYFENLTPVTGQPFCEVARSDAADVEKALDAAHGAAKAWGKTAPAERAAILNKIADRIEANRDSLALAEVWDNGKPIRETLAADIPLSVDHFRYFASAIRAQEGSLSQIDDDTVAYHFHEPLGVVGQIIPWNFPILMATWKLAPALAAGNTAVLKPAEQTPASVLYLMSLIGDLLPPGVVNVVNGFGAEAGKPLASSNRIAKVSFTGETTTGRLIMQYASQNLIPVTLELGGKSPNIFFNDVMAAHDDFQDKALEGFTMFALNQGEVCTCPSRSLVPSAPRRSGREIRWTPRRWSARRRPTTSWKRCCPTSRLAKMKARGFFAVANAPSWAATSPVATTCSQPSSPAPTRCGSSKKRSSDRWSRSRRSRITTTPSRSPTTPSTAWARECGVATGTPPTGPVATSRPAECG